MVDLEIDLAQQAHGISIAEMQSRRAAVKFVRKSCALEGLSTPHDLAAIEDRYAAGLPVEHYRAEITLYQQRVFSQAPS